MESFSGFKCKGCGELMRDDSGKEEAKVNWKRHAKKCVHAVGLRPSTVLRETCEVTFATMDLAGKKIVRSVDLVEFIPEADAVVVVNSEEGETLLAELLSDAKSFQDKQIAKVQKGEETMTPPPSAAVVQLFQEIGFGFVRDGSLAASFFEPKAWVSLVSDLKGFQATPAGTQLTKAWAVLFADLKECPVQVLWVANAKMGAANFYAGKEATQRRRFALFAKFMLFLVSKTASVEPANSSGDDLLQAENLAFPQVGALLSVPSLSIQRSALELFIVTEFLSKSPRGSGGESKGFASVATLLKLCKDMFWLVTALECQTFVEEARAKVSYGECARRLQERLTSTIGPCISARCLLKIASKYVKKEDGVIAKKAIIVCGPNQVLVNGTVFVDASFFGKFFDSIVRRMRTLVCELMVVDTFDNAKLAFSKFLGVGSVLVDNMQLQTVDADLNSVHNVQICVLRNNVLEPKGGNTFRDAVTFMVERLEMQKSVKQEENLLQWVKVADEFVALLIPLMQLGSGGPQRGTELLNLRVCNEPNRKRNVFIVENKITWHLAVQKTEHTQGGRRGEIVRQLNERASEAVIMYILLFRAMHSILTRRVYTSSSPTLFRTSFWIARGEEMGADWLRRVFRRFSFQLINIDLRLSTFRHLAHWAVTTLVQPACARVVNQLAHISQEQLLFCWDRLGVFASLAAAPIQYGLIDMAGHSVATAFGAYGDDLHSSVGEKSRLQVDLQLLSAKVWSQEILENYGSFVSNTFFVPSILTAVSGVAKMKFQLVCGKGPLAAHVCQLGDCSSEECMLSAMRSALSWPHFRSEAQRAVVMLSVRDPTKSFVFILPTNGGKTAIIFLPLLFDVAHHGAVKGLTVVVTPLVMLRDSQIDALNSMAGAFVQPCVMSWQDLKQSRLIHNYVHQPQAVNSVTVLMVTPEAADTADFKSFYSQMVAMNRVARVVFDEAHLLLQDYRPACKKVFHELLGGPALGKVPFTMLTATLPLEMRNRMEIDTWKKEFSDVALWPTVFRAKVVTRTNISVGAKSCQSKDDAYEELGKALAHFRTAVLPTDLDVNILFVQTIPATESVVAFLQGSLLADRATEFRHYHSSLADDVKAECLKWWYEKRGWKVLVSTTAFGEGLDHKMTRVVVHFCGVFSMVNLFQEIGRAGRDGKPAFALFLFEEQFASKLKKSTSTGEVALSRWLDESKTLCRISVWCDYFDEEKGVTCSMRGISKCDLCARAGHESFWMTEMFATSDTRIADFRLPVRGADSNKRSVVQANVEDFNTSSDSQKRMHRSDIEDSPFQETPEAAFPVSTALMLFEAMARLKILPVLSPYGQVEPCWKCRDAKCQCFQNSRACHKCGEKHFNKNCTAAKLPSNVFCFSCFMPVNHTLSGGVKFPCLRKMRDYLKMTGRFLTWINAQSWDERENILLKVLDEMN